MKPSKMNRGDDMEFIKYKKLAISFVFIISINSCFAIPKEMRDKGFVYLNEIDPTILISLHYSSTENFLGTVVDGYKKPVLILTKQAADALKCVQEEVRKDGYSLVVYDAYRPQCAVNHFVTWGQNSQDQVKKKQYYPRIDKAKVFELGYVAKRSGHSRGSTVDITLIKIGNELHPVKEYNRKLIDGYAISILDDGTVDMGSSFDLFDLASHYESSLINPKYAKLRSYLRSVMVKHGFRGCAEEWWHFTLKEEPFPANKNDSYFDFEID